MLSDLFLELPDPLKYIVRNVIALLDHPVQQHDAMPRPEHVKNPNLFAAQFKKAAAQRRRPRLAESIATFPHQLDKSGSFIKGANVGKAGDEVTHARSMLFDLPLGPG